MYLNSPGVPTHSLRHVKLLYFRANRERFRASPLCKVHCARHGGRDAHVGFFGTYTQANAYLCTLELSGFPVLIHNPRLLHLCLITLPPRGPESISNENKRPQVARAARSPPARQSQLALLVSDRWASPGQP